MSPPSEEAGDYRRLLHTIAESPGLTADEIVSTATVDDPDKLLDRAKLEGDVVSFAGRYWIVRKGEFAFDEYDHPETSSSAE